jgi:protein-S-isoprenylcysteine O-methyltransferase Ste14
MNPVILIAGTLFLIYLSWIVSVKDKRYHGIYRFFSFESIFLIILINFPVWFRNVLSTQQIISWILLIGSLVFAIWGVVLLYKMGKPAEGHLERTTTIVTTGLYGYIRHPLYLSLILLGFGAMLKKPGYIQIILSIINLIALILTARVEEGEMIKKFGNEYRDYMKKTKMFFPFVL